MSKLKECHILYSLETLVRYLTIKTIKLLEIRNFPTEI